MDLRGKRWIWFILGIVGREVRIYSIFVVNLVYLVYSLSIGVGMLREKCERDGFKDGMLEEKWLCL